MVNSEAKLMESGIVPVNWLLPIENSLSVVVKGNSGNLSVSSFSNGASHSCWGRGGAQLVNIPHTRWKFKISGIVWVPWSILNITLLY